MNALIEEDIPMFSDFYIYRILLQIYNKKTTKYMRGDTPSRATQKRVIQVLSSENIIIKDQDYSRIWRLRDYRMLEPEEKVCLVDPFAFISHLSALQKYSFTNRRPKELHITTPSQLLQKHLKNDLLEKSIEESELLSPEDIPKFVIPSHPRSVGGRKISNHKSSNQLQKTKIRGTFSNISNIARTFHDTLEKPEFCGGMSHVLDIWEEFSIDHLDSIINLIDKFGTPIVKVRAGYIIEERLKVNSPIVESWIRYAQRGGSRLLDPAKAYIDNYSEKWMLSIND